MCHDIPSHRSNSTDHLLLWLPHHAIVLSLWASGKLRDWLTELILLLTLILEHVIILLLSHFILRRLSILCSCLRLRLFIHSLRLSLSLIDLMRLWSLHHLLFNIVLIVLVVYDQDGIIVLLWHLMACSSCC